MDADWISTVISGLALMALGGAIISFTNWISPKD